MKYCFCFLFSIVLLIFLYKIKMKQNTAKLNYVTAKEFHHELIRQALTSIFYWNKRKSSSRILFLTIFSTEVFFAKVICHCFVCCLLYVWHQYSDNQLKYGRAFWLHLYNMYYLTLYFQAVPTQTCTVYIVWWYSLQPLSLCTALCQRSWREV